MRAIVASAVLVAARKVETSRRSDAKQLQENAVKAMLKGLRFTEIEPRYRLKDLAVFIDSSRS